jgi:tRNA1(Val) A37 N6-methylase TrmN6
MELTNDYILNGQLSMLQPKNGYRIALDPIILSNFVQLEAGQSLLDVGCGVGAISLIIKLKNPAARVTAIDIDTNLCDLCLCNAKKNFLEIDVVNSALENFSLPEQCLFDYVVTNPPFFDERSHRISTVKRRANFETMVLSEWIALCLKKLKNRGTFCIIHRPARLGEILACLEQKTGNIEIIPIFPKTGQDAIRIVVRSQKGSGGTMRIANGLVLHRQNGQFRKETENVLGGGYPYHGNGVLSRAAS